MVIALRPPPPPTRRRAILKLVSLKVLSSQFVTRPPQLLADQDEWPQPPVELGQNCSFVELNPPNKFKQPERATCSSCGLMIVAPLGAADTGGWGQVQRQRDKKSSRPGGALEDRLARR